MKFPKNVWIEGVSMHKCVITNCFWGKYMQEYCRTDAIQKNCSETVQAIPIPDVEWYMLWAGLKVFCKN